MDESENVAPSATAAHHTPEHFMPLLVAAGSGGAAERLHHSWMYGSMSMASYMFGPFPLKDGEEPGGGGGGGRGSHPPPRPGPTPPPELTTLRARLQEELDEEGSPKKAKAGAHSLSELKAAADGPPPPAPTPPSTRGSSRPPPRPPPPDRRRPGGGGGSPAGRGGGGPEATQQTWYGKQIMGFAPALQGVAARHWLRHRCAPPRARAPRTGGRLRRARARGGAASRPPSREIVRMAVAATESKEETFAEQLEQLTAKEAFIKHDPPEDKAGATAK